MSSVTVGKTELAIDLMLMMLVTAFAFGLAYHPYFFGDELILSQIAVKRDYSLWPMLLEINAYKPRLIFNGIVALLAKWQMERWVTAALQVACVIWINALLYGVVRYLFKGGRVLAWLLIAIVLTSRFGMVFYYDYSSGLLDLLSTALLLSALVAAWLAWRGEFVWWYAVAAIAAAVLCIFVHERYVAGLLTAGLAIAIAEWLGPSARRRIPVVGWALSLGIVPLLLFWIANTAFGSMPMATGTAGVEVELGWDTLWSGLMYSYNVLLGGNYGPSYFWGAYNHLHPHGRILGWGTATVTVVLIAAVFLQRGIAWRNCWSAAGLAAVAFAMIAVASLPGSAFLQARWMFPVGILVAMIWIIAVEGVWRYVAIAVILVTNVIYLVLGTHSSVSQVYSSRSASSLAASLLIVVPNGKSGIIVGNEPDGWTIGGCCAIESGGRLGDTFSRVSLKSAIHIDPFVAGREFDPVNYDFGLAFDGLGPDHARYRLVSVREAFVIAGIPDSDKLPVKAAPAGNAASNRNAPDPSVKPTSSEEPPSLGTVAPASGSGWTQTFTATYLHPEGAKKVISAWFLAERTLTGTHSCFLEYNSSNDSVILMNDAGSKWLTALPAGSNGVMANSQCSVDVAGVHGTADGNTLTVTFPITFASAYAGPKQIFLLASGPKSHSQWVQKGAWVAQ